MRSLVRSPPLRTGWRRLNGSMELRRSEWLGCRCIKRGESGIGPGLGRGFDHCTLWVLVVVEKIRLVLSRCRGSWGYRMLVDRSSLNRGYRSLQVEHRHRQ